MCSCVLLCEYIFQRTDLQPMRNHVLIGGFPSLHASSNAMAGLVNIRFAVALLGTISAVSADDDCGAAGWTVPSPPSGATLLQIQAIIR